MKPAIFLDRDGVVIENCPDYVRSWDDVKFYPSAVQNLARYAKSPYKIVLVTNQSVVGRGIISLAEANEINQKILLEFESNGIRIDGVFMCPHAPKENCNCRKPRPGLLHQAAQTLSINLSKSVMIGDAWTDLLAGQAAGVARVGLVLTGRGQNQLNSLRPPDLSSNYSVCKDLSCALESLLDYQALDGINYLFDIGKASDS